MLALFRCIKANEINMNGARNAALCVTIKLFVRVLIIRTSESTDGAIDEERGGVVAGV